MESASVSMIADLALMRGVTGAALRRIADSAALLRLGPGEPLFEASAPLRGVHIVTIGHVETFVERSGRRVAVDLMGPGSTPGFAAALLGTPPAIGARTATAAHLVAIPAEHLRALAAETPAFAERLLEAALHEAQRSTAAVVAQRTLSTVQRLARDLLEQVADASARPARFVLAIEKKWLAVRIGCSQENLSRAFATLRGYGVHTRGQTVVIEDPNVLGRVLHLSPAPRDGARSSDAGAVPGTPVRPHGRSP